MNRSIIKQITRDELEIILTEISYERFNVPRVGDLLEDPETFEKGEIRKVNTRGSKRWIDVWWSREGEKPFMDTYGLDYISNEPYGKLGNKLVWRFKSEVPKRY